MVRFSFLLLLFVFGCTSQADKNASGLKYNFLETQLENSKASFKLKMQGDEKRIAPIYQYASAVDDRCQEIINSISNNESPQAIKGNLEKLKQDMRGGWGPDSLLLKNADKAIDELIQLQNYSNGEEIINQVRLIDLAYMNHMHELIDRNTFVCDVLEILVKNQIGYEGKKFETELLPTSYHTTKHYLVRTGTGLDSSMHLTGKIDTIRSYNRSLPVYEVENPRKGGYNIPAEMFAPLTNGKTSPPIRFTIHYEIK
jgi:hypothetical protein